jgi:hypothetical protein
MWWDIFSAQSRREMPPQPTPGKPRRPPDRDPLRVLPLENQPSRDSKEEECK